MKAKLTIVIVLLILFICIINKDSEYFTTGFGVTSGISYYNKARRCQGEDMYGSRTPYCETIGTVVL